MAVIDELNIKEAFAEPHGVALRDLAREVAREGSIFIEIGPWKGYSTSFLGEVARECNGCVFCVDHWEGSKGVKRLEDEASTVDVFFTFKVNMKALGLTGYVRPLLMESVVAASLIKDGIADLVFIDADHRYEAIKEDVKAWWPKVKTGGVLCGHDCERIYTELDQMDRAEIDRTLNIDFNLGLQCHSGVVKALGEFFGNKITIIGTTTIWYVKRGV